jgi:hypothetical protein
MEHLQAQDGTWVPFARGRIKALRATGLRIAAQKFVMPDGAEVVARIDGVHDFISIRYTAGVYEFFCSDINVLPATNLTYKNALLFTDSIATNTTDYTMTGSGVRRSKTTSKPLFSNNLTPPADASWLVIPLPGGPISSGFAQQVKFSMQDDPAAATQGRALTGVAWQNQKKWEYSWWHNNTNQVNMTSCLGFGLGLSHSTKGSWLANTGFLYDRLILNGADTGAVYFGQLEPAKTATKRIDFGQEAPGAWDVSPSIYSTAFTISAGHKRSTYANWRRAATQKVKIDGVWHWYAISSDRYGNFSCYRMTDYAADALNIPVGKVKFANPAYPGWAITFAHPDLAIDHWLFTFNKDGTLATSTPVEKVAAFAWVAHEDVTWTGCPTDYAPRSSCMLDNGPDFTNRFPTMGMLWPTAAQVATYEAANPTKAPANVRYTISREQVYVGKSQGSLSQAVYMSGSLWPLDLSRATATGPSTWTYGTPVSIANYDPAYIYKPGFIELSLTITPNSSDPDDFTFTATVLSSERYSDNKRYFVDCGYYAVNERTKDINSLPADDTLLTAEIEVYVKEPDLVVKDQAAYVDGVTPRPLGRYGLITHTNAGNLEAIALPTIGSDFANTHNALKADEPNCEGMLLAAYKGDVEVFYTVRERVSQVVVKRFCIAHNIQRRGVFTNTAGHDPYVGTVTGPAHVGVVRFADLRSLNFITRTYSLKAGTFNTTEFTTDRVQTDYAMSNWRPRHEVRVLGETMRTISYAKTNVHGFGADADPMTSHATPPGTHTKLPVTYTAPTGTQSNGTGSPDSFLLSVQLWAKEVLINNDIGQFIATHPKGHWSVYSNVASQDQTFDATASTENKEVFDIIKPHKGKESTHKASFNAAFKQNRDYSAYNANPLDAGGFCSAAFWTEKKPYAPDAT